MSVEQGEHTFAVEVLVSGEEIRGYSASEALTQGEPVEVDGDYTVGASTGDAFIGVALYDVAEGEEVAIAGDDCEVRIEAGEAIAAGDAITPDGTGAFAVATAREDQVGVANEGGGTGEIFQAYLTDNLGNVGEV